MRRKTFTVREANETIPLVRRIVEDVVHGYDELSRLAEEYKSLRLSRAADEKKLNRLKRRMAGISEDIESYVVELGEIGCEMKDLKTGLVDFPWRMDGRDVLLCWQLGEDRVEHWHEVTDGFAGRRPLPVTVHEE